MLVDSLKILTTVVNSGVVVARRNQYSKLRQTMPLTREMQMNTPGNTLECQDLFAGVTEVKVMLSIFVVEIKSKKYVSIQSQL
jgi:hypothetical protein